MDAMVSPSICNSRGGIAPEVMNGNGAKPVGAFHLPGALRRLTDGALTKQ
jgi:hypothetical protein